MAGYPCQAQEFGPVASFLDRRSGVPDIASNDSACGDVPGALGALRPEDPREIAGYRLLARIGEGGLGAVYLSHAPSGQPVALKVVRREYARDRDFRRCFQSDVRAARDVRGYHVVPVVGHDATGDRPWLAAAYIPGLSLDDALTAFGPLPPASVLQLTGCVAGGLRAVHNCGIVHRDLRPGNVLLSDDGPWLADFGLAGAAQSMRLTRGTGLIAAPQYMSPEHANGDALTPATDVFSLGLIAAVAATGRHPYGDGGPGGPVSLATRIANTARRPPDLSGYPDLLRPVLERCLTADPADRPAPAELAELCERAVRRPLRDFTDWLPEPLTAEIARRTAAAERPPAPEPLIPDAPSAGSGSGDPPGNLFGPVVATWSNWGTATPEIAPVGGTYRQQTLLAIAASVVALLLAVTLTFAFVRNSGHDPAPATPSPAPSTSGRASPSPSAPAATR
ncbi:serine/threonine-protein kinase [Streptomyces sp. H39-S7]|uniref:serine/threonine-protein kinase n=1 Tax=Streptomyces sp. H39-S7 TaxID=3004357 RepID=UPI0022AF83D3|nr:serine/threonine-protein kinase [Streptomyces sp. H39-S7]MCZ4118774.1 serine/threonine-protein kinase [Streptomyces sp. H39-S7]